MDGMVKPNVSIISIKEMNLIYIYVKDFSAGLIRKFFTLCCLSKILQGLGLMVHSYNPSYSGSRT
jgi:hypothetical protein